MWNHKHGYCPNCLEQNDFDAYPAFLEDGSEAGTAVCPRCKTTYTTGNHGTLAKARRSQSARDGWIMRRERFGASGRKDSE